MSSLKKHCPKANFTVVNINNGADDYCNKEESRVPGEVPWTFGIKPARLNRKGDLARRNKDLLEMGPEKAVEEGIIALANYPKVKSAIDLYSNCT